MKIYKGIVLNNTKEFRHLFNDNRRPKTMNESIFTIEFVNTDSRMQDATEIFTNLSVKLIRVSFWQIERQIY